MEISDEQFDRLVGMIAESRVEFRAAMSDLQLELRTGIAGIRSNQVVIKETLSAIEAELNQIHIKQRSQDQALDGLTQLGKTNFDMNESVLKALHDGLGSSTMHHGDAEENRDSGPQ